MNKNIQDMDNIFKQTIETYEEMPNASVWNAIDKNLDKKTATQLQKKYSYLKKIVAVLLVLLISTVTYYQLKQYNQNDVAIKNTEFNSKKEVQNKNIENGTVILGKNKDEQKNNKVVQTINNIVNTNIEETNALESKIVKPKLEKKFVLSNKIYKSKNFNTTNQNIENKTKKEKQFITNNSKKIKSKKLEIEDEAIITENSNTNNDNLLSSDLIQTFAIDNETIAFHTPNAFDKQPYAIIEKAKKQNAINKKRNVVNKFSITTFVSPELAFNRLENDEPHGNRLPPQFINNGQLDNKNRIKEQESHVRSFTTGLLFDYSFSKKWSIQSGLVFNAKSTEINPKKVFAENDNNGKIRYRNNCSFGTTYIDPKTGTTVAVGDSAITRKTLNKVNYIGMPVNVSYHFTKSKFIISPFVGIALNFLVKQKASTGLADANTTTELTDNKIEGLKNIYSNANIGLQVGYTINKKLSIIASPNIKFALSSVNKNVVVKAFPNTFGLMAGLKINL